MDEKLSEKFNKSSFLHNFAIGALAATLVIDMMLGFPIAHYSIFGQHLTAFSSSIIVPPLDNLALVMGFEPISASAAAGGTSASTAFQATTIMSGEAGFEACVASGGLTHFHGTELACHP